MTPSSSAAWNAADSEQLRMPPPESLNWVARKSMSRSSAIGASSGSSSRQIRLRSSASGNGKSITKSRRRTNASSMLRRKLVARMTAPA